MRSRLLLVVLFMAAFTACDGNQLCVIGCSGGQHTSGPSALPSPTPTATPTPTPLAGTTPLPDPCDPDSVTLEFHSSPADDKTIGPNESRQLDFTPMKNGIEIPKSCNTARWPEWTVETAKVVPTSLSTCSLLGTFHSYIPVLTASNRTGDHCLVRGVLTVSSGDKVVKHEAVFEAVVR